MPDPREGGVRWLAEHRHWSVVVVLLITVLALLALIDPRSGTLRLQVDASIDRLLPMDDADRSLFDRVHRQFGDTEPVLLAVPFDPVFTLDHVQRIDRLTRAIEALPGVSSVLSLSTVSNPVVNGDDIDLRSLSAQLREQPEALADLAARLRENPLYRDTLVSADGRVALFAIGFADVDENRFREQGYAGQLRALAHEVAGAHTAWVTGTPVIKAATTDAVMATVRFTLPAIFALIVTMLLLVYRDLGVTVWATLTIALATLWTMGFAAWTGMPINLVTVLVPPLVATLGLSYAVHLLAEALAPGREPDAAGRYVRVLRRMGASLLLSGATTIAGLLALVPGSLPAVGQFAALASLGVACAVLLSLLFLPVVLGMRMRRRRPLFEARFRIAARKLAQFNLRWRDLIIAIGMLTLVVDLYFSTRIEVGTEYIKSFAEDTEVRRDYDRINADFAGATSISILVDTHLADALLRPALMQEVDGLQRWLREQPEIGAVVSYIDALKWIQRTFNGDDPAFERLPDDATLAKQLMVLAGPESLRRLIDPSFRSALLVVRIKVDGSREIAELVRRIEGRVQVLPPPLSARVTGSPVLATRTTEQIASGQLTSLLIAFAVIWALLALMFMSLRSAALALLPNLVPVGLYFGTLGMLGISLNPTTSLIACIVLGIAVDDTIHFLARFSADARERGSERMAVRSALRNILRPVTFTTFALCLGFLVFTGTDLQNQVQFGALAAFTLFAAGIADLTLTPALGSRLRIVTLWDIVRLDLGQSPMHTIALMNGLSLRQARLFALMMRLERLPAGTRLVQEGDYAGDMYVVIDGELDIWVEREGQHKQLSVMRRGATIGEAGFFGQRRTANATSRTPVRMLRFDAQDLERLRRRYPRIAAVVYRNLNRIQAERLARVTAML